MTVTFAYLVGDFEQPAETLRKLIYDNWDETKTLNQIPKMISPQGFNGEPAAKETDKQLSTNDWIAAKQGDLIRFKTTDHTQQKPEDMDNSHTRKNYIVQIDILATHSLLSGLIREQIEDILFENIPSSNSRILKSDGQTSSIVTFDRQSIEWTEIGSFEFPGLVREWQGEIGCLMQKNKTF